MKPPGQASKPTGTQTLNNTHSWGARTSSASSERKGKKGLTFGTGVSLSRRPPPAPPRFPVRNHSFCARQPLAAPAGAMANWPQTRVIGALPHRRAGRKGPGALR